MADHDDMSAMRHETHGHGTVPGRVPGPVDCRAALSNLQDYLKREITPELAVEIKQHLERCRPCFSHARFEENFLQMLAARAGKATCPEVLRAKIMAALRAGADDI